MRCTQCQSEYDLRPYGVNSSIICYDCAMSTPESKAEAERHMDMQFRGIEGPIVVGLSCGPIPFENSGIDPKYIQAIELVTNKIKLQ